MDKVRFSVKAPYNYLVNRLIKQEISIINVSENNKYICFSVPLSYEKKARAYLDSLGAEYNVIGKFGTQVTIRELFKRLGIGVGVICFLISCYLYTFLITDLVILGTVNLDRQIIEEVVDKYIQFPCFNVSVNTVEIEKELVANEGISNATVRRVGNSLEINILEELPRIGIVDTITPVPLVADKDAIVTKLIVLQGTPLVKIGDSVKKGQILIAPYNLGIDDVQIPIRAMGYVEGRTFGTQTFNYPDIMKINVRTGRTTQINNIDILKFGRDKSCNYELFEKISHSFVIKGILSIRITQTTYYEIEEKIVENAFLHNQESMIKAEMDNVARQLESKNVKRQWFYVKRLDKNTVLDIYYEIEEIISYEQIK